AQSFTDLLNRYKYLQLIAAYDRTLVDDVVTLERDLARQEQLLTDHLSLLQRLAAEKAAEDAQLRQIETEQAQVIEAARQQERALADRLEQLARDEARISSLIDELEQRRLEAERRAAVAGAPAAAPGSISTSDLGALRWPVEGQLLYRFGTEVRPNGVRLRWNGIGIGAPVGTPVSAVGSGTVVMAAPLEGYGPSVVLDHGDGYYTLYLHLASIAVAEGQFVQGGQVLGTVGGERTAEGPHIEFRVHAPGPGGAPLPVDPLSWLQLRAEP
ncbi:MAG TPA: peptidoglycan DD-metalloendopeptidase family protein, partial [Longimicrobiales bacterium]|nr:peptidoglycan DD-metalloendopeptidase family protein [Longimicrobiales bacterium]